jgi:RNA polymerase sigma-70 factor (sigma-E family)
LEDELQQEQAEEFEAFARAQMQSLLQFGVLLTGRLSDGEDLLQSSLAKTLMQWPRVSRADRPDHYVRRIMVNTHRTSLARAWRRREISVSEVPDSGSQVDEMAGTDETAVLLAALSALPKGQRAVVILRCAEDRSEAEAALILGVTIGTVKSQLHKALARLREHPALNGDRSDR